MITRTDVINKLFEKYNFQSYLEIGVEVPALNFDVINATLKHSVDPNPIGKCDFIMESDEFFKNHIGNQKYDVIFVDGMHTNEQAYKDVINGMKHLNENGIIVMHDCNPPTEYFARSYEEYQKTRGGWNGTVYCGFIRLKHEFPCWSCFIIDEDWGCAILTERNLLDNKQINYLDVYDWKYFDDNRNNLLQLITYDEYLKLLEHD